MSLPPSRGGLVCKYIERNLVHSSGDYYGKPFRLTSEQKRFIYRAYEMTEAGGRRYRRVLCGRPKGDGKTELAAAIGCVELALAGQHGFPASPEIPVAAASFEQADTLFSAARVMISEGKLAPFFEVFDTEILRKDGPGRMFRVAAAAGTNDGLRPTFFLADELHEWTGAKERVHLVLENGLAKRRESWSLGISTAGSDKATLLGRLYEKGKKVAAGELDDPTFLFDWLEAPEQLDLDKPGDLLEAVQSCNPHAEGFGTLDNILRRFDEVPRFEFERYHLNRWTTADDAWIEQAAWDACRGTVELERAEHLFIGVDIGIKKDSTGVVECGWVDDKLHVRSTVLEPSDQSPVTVADARELVYERASDRLAEAVYDPHAFSESAQDLEERGVPMVEFPPNNSLMVPASEKLYELIREGRLVHDGDPTLRRHVLAAVPQVTERGWRISKRRSREHIDACMALAYAAYRAVVSRSSPGRSRVPVDLV